MKDKAIDVISSEKVDESTLAPSGFLLPTSPSPHNLSMIKFGSSDVCPTLLPAAQVTRPAATTVLARYKPQTKDLESTRFHLAGTKVPQPVPSPKLCFAHEIPEEELLVVETVDPPSMVSFVPSPLVEPLRGEKESETTS